MIVDHIVVYTTTGSETEAEKIAEALVSEKLAACVQYMKINSVYRWQDKINKDVEFLLILKTKKRLYKAVEKRIRELHSYECPEIIATPIAEGSKSYLNWINENTKN